MEKDTPKYISTMFAKTSKKNIGKESRISCHGEKLDHFTVLDKMKGSSLGLDLICASNPNILFQLWL